MLVRSTSTRRTRASRNVSGSPQGYAGSSATTSSPVSRGRRASVATDKAISLGPTSIDSIMDRQRSPRGSMLPPNIALENDDSTPDESDESLDIIPNNHEPACDWPMPVGRRFLPDPEFCVPTRGGLMPGPNPSPRNSLVPDEYCRSPRGSLVPPETSYNRSPRSSLVPGGLTHSRNCLIPTENGNSRNSIHSLLPDGARSPRGSMSNIEFDRSPRGSICPDVSRSARGSLVPDQERSPRGSICPEMSRSPRGSIVPMDMERTPRGSVIMDYHNHSPRGSIVPEPNRSPRGSICPEGNRSPRGSIAAYEMNRSPRGSVGGQPDFDRTPRGSIGDIPVKNKSPRGSIGPEIDRSPRGSLGGQERRARALTPQDPRRASADQGIGNRNVSPYRQRDGTAGNGRPENCGPQNNLGYGTNAWADSRRASSSVSQEKEITERTCYDRKACDGDLSNGQPANEPPRLLLQFSGDESRKLCGGNVSTMEKRTGPLSVATYGTLVFQLKDAHREASGECDFVFRAMRAVSKTLPVIVCLGCLSAVPIVMLIMGLQFKNDCPINPDIPLYMIVGGSLGTLRMFWALYSQIRSRRLEVLSTANTRPHISPMQLVCAALTIFLSIWFILGNYWILRISWPAHKQPFFEPSLWCDKTLYIFSIVHIGIVYSVIAVSLLTAAGLALCRYFACPWFERYR